MAGNLPGNFDNPFDGTSGANNAYEDLAIFTTAVTAKSGLVSYADRSQNQYIIKGYGKSAALALQLTSGQ